MSEAPILEVKNLCKHFPVFSDGLVKKQVGLVKACDDVSFTLPRGQTLGLVGESGCGKTTTSRAILRPSLQPRARFFFDRRPEEILSIWPPFPKGPQAFAPIYADDLSRPLCFPKPQDDHRASRRRAPHHPRLGLWAEKRDRIVAMLEMTGLSGDHLQRYPHEFSGGQRQHWHRQSLDPQALPHRGR